MNRKRLDTLIGAITIILSAFLIYYFARDIRRMERVILSFGPAGPIAAIVIYGALSVTPIPTDPLTVLCGLLFGPFIGIATAWAGNSLAALLEYYVGRYFGRVIDFEKARKKLPFGLKHAPADSFMFLFFGRFIPGYGAKFVSIVAGMYKVSTWKYFWTAALSNLVGAMMFAFGVTEIIKSFIKNP